MADVLAKNGNLTEGFCDGFFSLPSLDKVVKSGKSASKEKKLLHGATIGKRANENLTITDLVITIRNEDKPDEIRSVTSYGPLNSKMLARTICDENFHHVRQNYDNWTAYAMAKYIQDKVGVYPILPLTDAHVYDDNAKKPKALFLTKGDQTLVNQEIYNDTLANGPLLEKLNSESYTVGDFTFRPDSDYPQWYIEALRKARSGDLDGTRDATQELPQEQPQELPQEPPAPPKASKTIQWYFYMGDAGKGSDPCNSDPIDTQFEAPAGDSWPTADIEGEWEFEVPDLGKCKFQGIGSVGTGGDNGCCTVLIDQPSCADRMNVQSISVDPSRRSNRRRFPIAITRGLFRRFCTRVSLGHC
ncbi:hypothetical protein BU23DRAFT_563968 [Bimuria novae-zelandiae CBS 107.79]|uniref:Uncharacterized protein n=1 Tax=Bimuria novae-zelandiae CBS 107.79 TaxID=1447943 RepID=A0A6A5VN80_9PLEO|nr:hypothetical protein BU23DRAFT_563968 [Bimuria novae-zelandiae CBS 107.79]